MLNNLLIAHSKLKDTEWLVIKFGVAELNIDASSYMYTVATEDDTELVINTNGYELRLLEEEIKDFYIDHY